MEAHGTDGDLIKVKQAFTLRKDLFVLC
jgi:hypothetical protein